MMRSFYLLIALFVSAVAVGQSRLYVDPNFAQIGYSHKTIAILPFKTSVSLRPKQMNELKEGDLERMEKDESYSIQQSLYSWFLMRKSQNKLWVDVEDIAVTNATLAKNGITYDNVHEYSPEELAKLLGVDAIIRGNFLTNKPMSEGASVALGLLIGFYGVTNQVTMNLFIHNGEDGKPLVNYHKTVSGIIGSSTDQLINIIKRKTSRKIPYTKPKS